MAGKQTFTQKKQSGKKIGPSSKKDHSQRVSACIVIKDEEKQIKGLLDNLNDVVDDYVIVHDGPCKDRSLEIAQKYTDKVYVREWTGQAETHRPFAFERCKGDWILWIDADEGLTPEIKRRLPEILRRLDVSCCCFLEPTFIGKRQIKKGYWGRQYRETVLFRKSQLLPYKGLPNELVYFRAGKKIKIPLYIEHHPPGEKHTWKSFKKDGIRTANAYAKLFHERSLNRYPRLFYLMKAPIWFFVHMFYFLIWKGAILDGWDNIVASFWCSLYNFMVWWKVAFYRPKHSAF